MRYFQHFFLLLFKYFGFLYFINIFVLRVPYLFLSSSVHANGKTNTEIRDKLKEIEFTFGYLQRISYYDYI